MPDLGRTVRRCSLTSTAVGGDCYSRCKPGGRDHCASTLGRALARPGCSLTYGPPETPSAPNWLPKSDIGRGRTRTAGHRMLCDLRFCGRGGRI